jgi:hypothetical protein
MVKEIPVGAFCLAPRLRRFFAKIPDRHGRAMRQRHHGIRLIALAKAAVSDYKEVVGGLFYVRSSG